MTCFESTHKYLPNIRKKKFQLWRYRTFSKRDFVFPPLIWEKNECARWRIINLYLRTQSPVQIPPQFHKWNLSKLTGHFSRAECHKVAQICSPRFWPCSTSRWTGNKFALRQFCRPGVVREKGEEEVDKVINMGLDQGTRKECCLDVCQDSVLRAAPTSPVLLPQHT